MGEHIHYSDVFIPVQLDLIISLQILGIIKNQGTAYV
jgi:hypothetical protein